jgi:transposase-like protein
MNYTPSSLLDAVRYFSDLRVCNDYMRGIKWPGGEPVCHHCGSVAVYELSTRPVLKCRDCKKQFSYKVGTIFEDSPLGLDKWFVAVWAIANAKNGISSHELGRALGVTQKSAWFMLHRVREAMRAGGLVKLAGTVEVDETYVGGEARNMHKAVRERKIRGRGAVGKRCVQGLLQRGDGDKHSTIVAKTVVDTDALTLAGGVRRHVEPGANVYTDAHRSYSDLWLRFQHQAADHATEYVRGQVHTNGLENFWSLFKRTVKGTYVHVAPFHLQRYVDEQVYRFNNRKIDDGERFVGVMSTVLGRRITYRQLCEIDGCGFMGLE